MKLLRARYSDHTLQEIPDAHSGDLGLEAFTHDGVVFQCYAVQEPLTTKLRYERQRDKLTEDLNKLKRNKDALVDLFGSVKIQRYVLMVPRTNSRSLVAHAQTKAAEVRGWDLPFIHEGFAVVVETDDSYPVERNLVLGISGAQFVTEPVSTESLELWGSEHTELMAESRRKLESIGLTGHDLDRYLSQLLGQYLAAENALEGLHSRWPDGWNAVSRTKSLLESSLAIEYPGSSCHEDVIGIVVDLETRITAAAEPLRGETAHTLAWGAVADWIMRCPLDF